MKISGRTIALTLVIATAACSGTEDASDGQPTTTPDEVAQAAPPAPPAEGVAAPQPGAPPEKRPGMAYIPAGEFLMGSDPNDARVYPWEKPREQPQHPVYVDAFYMDTHEVSNVQYERFRPQHKRDRRSSCDDCPVVKVSWFDAQAYCARQDPPKRLPTEAEWEKAAKGGVARLGGRLDTYAWYSNNAPRDDRTRLSHASPVGTKAPNAYGLHDMLGNAREWTADWYDPSYYRLDVRDNPTGPESGARRVERGGAFFLPARGVSPTIRYNHPPRFRLYFLGFRCAQDP
jgi:formylglycine-generating enzyme required for sulfatase activity